MKILHNSDIYNIAKYSIKCFLLRSSFDPNLLGFGERTDRQRIVKYFRSMQNRRLRMISDFQISGFNYSEWRMFSSYNYWRFWELLTSNVRAICDKLALVKTTKYKFLKNWFAIVHIYYKLHSKSRDLLILSLETVS